MYFNFLNINSTTCYLRPTDIWIFNHCLWMILAFECFENFRAKSPSFTVEFLAQTLSFRTPFKSCERGSLLLTGGSKTHKRSVCWHVSLMIKSYLGKCWCRCCCETGSFPPPKSINSLFITHSINEPSRVASLRIGKPEISSSPPPPSSWGPSMDSA